MSIVQLALKKPYTIAATVILTVLLGIFSAQRMPTDIFPEIDIPVVSVVWAYGGMSADEVQTRIVNIHQRGLASAVDDIKSMESTCYSGVGVIKVYLHEGADIAKAVAQLSASAQSTMKYMPRNIVPPLVVRYSATDVPILQLSLASETLLDVRLNDFGQNVIRPSLVMVHGTQIHTPYGGKPKMIMVDLDLEALHARGLTPNDVADALAQQNLILPTGSIKTGEREYTIRINNSTDTVEAMNSFPIKRVGDTTIFLRDVGHVHNGFQVQTNSVSVDGRPGSLMMIRKTGGVSTLKVIDGVLAQLPDIAALMPKGMQIKPIFDQSMFVKAAIHSVLMGGAIAAVLTGIMILLFLGNWRLTVIIIASIPLSVLAALIVMNIGGESLNTMTLGGFALAVGILVDNATVVIENIERNLGLGRPLEPAILQGAREVGVPTMVSTLAICIVFVPIFLLEGTAKYLFTPLAVSVIVSLLASLAISFTLVPVLFKYLIGPYAKKHGNRPGAHDFLGRLNIFLWIHLAFEAGYNRFRNAYRQYLAWAVHHPVLTAGAFALLVASGAAVFPDLGMDFFPSVDAGQMRLHVRAPAGTRIEQTQQYFAEVEREIRRIVGDDIDIMLDNIGLSYSGSNIALSDSATVGPMDGDVLIALREGHKPTADYMAELRRVLPEKFPQLTFFFQPSDIVNQVLNFGLPAPIDIRVGGPNDAKNYATAVKIADALRKVPGLVDVHIYQVPDAPGLRIEIDRTLAKMRGLNQGDVARSILVALSSSASFAPNFWINPANQVSYQLAVQAPTYNIDSMSKLQTLPVSGSAALGGEQVLMGLAEIKRTKIPAVLSQLNMMPIYDVHADIQGCDLASAAAAIDRVIEENRPPASDNVKVFVAGQIETMRSSFFGLKVGMAAAVFLVYLLMVVNFQSWLDPLIVLMAVPCALSGVAWMLFITGTHISVPALMGALMCIGLTTANSILVVSFARQQIAAGDQPLVAAVAAGYTRLRPVIMTAGAMILGMIPMSMGIGEGGEQNAPLGRAVIGGLVFATLATLIFVPAMFRLMHRSPGHERAALPLTVPA